MCGDHYRQNCCRCPGSVPLAGHGLIWPLYRGRSFLQGHIEQTCRSTGVAVCTKNNCFSSKYWFYCYLSKVAMGDSSILVRSFLYHFYKNCTYLSMYQQEYLRNVSEIIPGKLSPIMRWVQYHVVPYDRWRSRINHTLDHSWPIIGGQQIFHACRYVWRNRAHYV